MSYKTFVQRSRKIRQILNEEFVVEKLCPEVVHWPLWLVPGTVQVPVSRQTHQFLDDCWRHSLTSFSYRVRVVKVSEPLQDTMFRLQIPRSKFVGFFYFFRQMSRMTCREPRFLVKMSWKQLTPTRKVENTGCFSHMWFTILQPLD